eukprot:scaffold1605_cov141-Cylindrotheca_fusiformis.AAC.24
MAPLDKDHDHFWLFHTKPEPTVVGKPKKSVRFATHSYQYNTINRAEFSRQEIIDCWYTREDYHSFSGDVKTTVRILEDRDPWRQINDIDFTARGSLCRTEETARRRKQTRHGARDLVLQAQQQPNSTQDWIAMMYTAFSRPSSHEAVVQAMVDHRDSHYIQVESIRSFWDNFFPDNWIRFDSPPEVTVEAPDLLSDTSGFDESWLCGEITTI